VYRIQVYIIVMEKGALREDEDGPVIIRGTCNSPRLKLTKILISSLNGSLLLLGESEKKFNKSFDSFSDFSYKQY